MFLFIVATPSESKFKYTEKSKICTKRLNFLLIDGLISSKKEIWILTRLNAPVNSGHFSPHGDDIFFYAKTN